MRMVIKVVVLLGVFTVLCLPGNGEAAVINAATCSRADVGAAINLASDGDTVNVPAGVCSWTSTLTVTKGITLAGAGIDQTVLLVDVPPAGGRRIMIFETVAGKSYRLTGFTFRHNTVLPGSSNGAVVIGGFSHAVRLDHLKFDDLYDVAIHTYGDVWGVIDHIQFLTSRNGQAVVVWHNVWGGVGSYGDNSWATPTELGTAKAIYIEDSTFTVLGTMQTVIDAEAGARYVVRNSTFNNAAAGGHGTDSTGRYRSLRSYEFYNNTFTYPGAGGFAAIYVRGGTGVVFNNTFVGFTHAFFAATYRAGQSFAPWGACNGTSVYDGNVGPPAGYPCIDQVGRGRGTLLSGDSPSPAAWPNQQYEPVYTWGNLLGGADVNTQHAPVQLGRDLILNTPKPGYEPFVYPHPLVTQSGDSPPPPGPPAPPSAPAPPSNLRLQ